MSRLLERSIRIAEAYLQTAVIVDDQARLDDAVIQPTDLKTPGRRTVATAPEAEATATEVRHNLNVKPLVDSFAERGIICGVIVPASGVSVTALTVRAAERADIVLLDWQMNADNGRTALSIITELVQRDNGERLRFIGIFTGEQTLTTIGETISDALRGVGKEPTADDDRVVDFMVGHTRISIYAKSNSLPENLQDRSVSEEHLPARVIAEFATMTNGLVPAIALTALAALRTNASRILDKYHAGMDAPFLAHRACLPHPDDSSRHLSAAIAAEAGCVMEADIYSRNPVSIDAMMDWVIDAFGSTPEFIFQPDRKLNCDGIRELFSLGFEKQKESGCLSKRDRQELTRIISRDMNPNDCLDLELSWLMSFRTVYDDSPLPILRLGTVVRKCGTNGDSSLYVCMRPRCDCVRLDDAEYFHFLPLTDPLNEKSIQLSVRVNPNTFRRLVVNMKPSQWNLVKFAPVIAGSAVTASRDAKVDGYCFTSADESGTVYEWLGELKPEFAQRIANLFADQLSRVAVNNTEWLRRQEGATT